MPPPPSPLSLFFFFFYLRGVTGREGTGAPHKASQQKRQDPPPATRTHKEKRGKPPANQPHSQDKDKAAEPEAQPDHHRTRERGEGGGGKRTDWVSVHMVSDRSTDAATICERLAGQASGHLLRPAGCWMMGESLVNLQPGQGRAHPPSQHTPDNLQCLGSNPGLPGGIAWFPCFQTSCLIVTRWGCRKVHIDRCRT